MFAMTRCYETAQVLVDAWRLRMNRPTFALIPVTITDTKRTAANAAHHGKANGAGPGFRGGFP
jgi:hypothetical protein